MNILAVCHYGLYQDLSSSFVHNQLREFVKAGHNVRVIIPNGIGKKGRNSGKFAPALSISTVDGVELYDLRYITLSQYGKKHFNAASAVCAIRLKKKQIFNSFKPDVIHAHTLGFDSEIGAWLKKITNCPLVVTTHGGDVSGPLSKGKGNDIKITADKADKIVAVSNQLAEKTKSTGTSTDVISILNGFVPRCVPCENDRNEFGIIQVGHLIHSKRNEVTIRAFARLKEKYPALTLTIVGSGELRANLEQLCKELNIENSVTFTGQLSNEETFFTMCRNSYFVMVSKPEGFGIVYLEAMAAGCVCVGTKGQGISDVIVDNENGFLVEADDVDAVVEVLDSCLNDSSLRDNVAKAGQTTALALDWEANAKHYIDLFQQLTLKTGEKV